LFDGDRLTVKIEPTVFGHAVESGATLSLPDIPFDTPVDAVKWALGEMRRRVNTKVTGRGSAIGDPRLRVGRTLSIAGVGSRFSGPNYRLTSVSHSFDSGGYRTSFEARQELV